MTRPRRTATTEDFKMSDLAMGYLLEFGGSEDSLTDGFIRAYQHAERHGNVEKACVLYAMNHSIDEEFNPSDETP